ncbi:hypothetical protein MHYP_G00318850 [Metynnis hypsauchen]
MLSEFDKLRCPPPGQEQDTIICRRALEKYRAALYGTTISSVVDLLMRAHDLHSVLSPGCPDQPSEQGKRVFQAHQSTQIQQQVMLKEKWKMSLTVLIMASLTIVFKGKEAGRLVNSRKTSEEGVPILRGNPPFRN